MGPADNIIDLNKSGSNYFQTQHYSTVSLVSVCAFGAWHTFMYLQHEARLHV